MQQTPLCEKLSRYKPADSFSAFSISDRLQIVADKGARALE